MKGYKHKIGITLVEILIVVVIIATLATMVVGIATHISNQSKEQLTNSTFALLNAALGQFRDYGYRYPDPNYFHLKFPFDCNGLDVVAAPPILSLQETLCNALGLPLGSVSIIPAGVLYDPNYSGSEVLYFFLSRVSKSRKTLEKIDDSLITNLSVDKQPMNIRIVFLGGPKIFPLRRIIDPWGTTLHYDYYGDLKDYQLVYPSGTWADYIDFIKKSKRAFPEIISAGPDKIFGTGDDINNRKK